jgi:hypothetical protein
MLDRLQAFSMRQSSVPSLGICDLESKPSSVFLLNKYVMIPHSGKQDGRTDACSTLAPHRPFLVITKLKEGEAQPSPSLTLRMIGGIKS